MDYKKTIQKIKTGTPEENSQVMKEILSEILQKHKNNLINISFLLEKFSRTSREVKCKMEEDPSIAVDVRIEIPAEAFEFVLDACCGIQSLLLIGELEKQKNIVKEKDEKDFGFYN